MIPFLKMNGLGNDFVVVDARERRVAIDPARIAALADRRRGIGFDQFILIEPAAGEGAAAAMRIVNADGGEVESCGNAARCVAALLLSQTGAERVRIESPGGPMEAWAGREGMIAVDMGVPRFAAADIPLAPGAGDPQALVIEGVAARYGRAACVNVGNPHAVFFVEDPQAVPLATVGPGIERHPAFPRRVNVSFAAVTDRARIRARVWERGAGATRACGTAACAVAAVAHRLGRTGPVVEVTLPGGPLAIDVSGGRIVMEGPYALDGTGSITAGGFVRGGVPSGGQAAQRASGA